MTSPSPECCLFHRFRSTSYLPLTTVQKWQNSKHVDAATAIPLTGEFGTGDNLIDVFANGIVATPDGKTLIIGNSGTSKIFRVDPTTGHADEIIVDPPLAGLREGETLLDGSFLDGIVLYDGVLFILSPGDTPDLDTVQVVLLDDDMLTGTRGENCRFRHGRSREWCHAWGFPVRE